MFFRRAKAVSRNIPQRARESQYKIGQTVRRIGGTDVGIVMGASLVSDDDGIGFEYSVQFDDPNPSGGEWDGPLSHGCVLLEESDIEAT